jgi:hypothetical protein
MVRNRSLAGEAAEEVPMVGGHAQAPDTLSSDTSDYGIRRVTIEQFEFGGYRYTNLKDAVAEARRHATKADAP